MLLADLQYIKQMKICYCKPEEFEIEEFPQISGVPIILHVATAQCGGGIWETVCCGECLCVCLDSTPHCVYVDRWNPRLAVPLAR